jgi:hypothetical protein
MAPLTYDPDNTLAGGLYAMTPREAIALAMALCDAVEHSVGADGCHAGVWPGNMTFADGQLALGPRSEADISDMEPDALEFVPPEQFWSGERSPAGDVYSIGLVLYTALNDGVMPFFSADEARTPETRAAALQSRMRGKPLSYPAAAGRELGDVVLKATAFRAADRYATPGQLKAARSALPDDAAMPAAAPVIPMSSEALKNARSYKVDKNFESAAPDKPRKPRKVRPPAGAVDENMDAETFPQTRKKNRWILPTILIIIILAALFLLLRGCQEDPNKEFPIASEAPDTPPVLHSAVPDARPTVTAPVETTAPPEETEDPEDVTWTQAKDLCDQRGGHLATVRNEDEFKEIVKLAETHGAQFVWLGAYRAENSQWYYVTGDTLDFAVWDASEPSAVDSDGTREDYLLLWFRPAVGYWSYNDTRNDPISVVPRTYRGKIAYICQFDR